MANQVDIKYINKDFTSFKNELIEYARAYYPTVYNDFNQASPGSMFIEMASYIGDVLSFYLDNQLQETFLQYAKQKENLYTMSYMLGYRPKVSSAAIVDLDVYQQVPAKTVGGLQEPDFDYALIVSEGMQVRSNSNPDAYFYTADKVNFTVSSSLDPTEVNVYSTDVSGVPQSYILKKAVKAISGLIKTTSFTFGTPQRFSKVYIQDTDIIGIVSAQDNSANAWYEVPYLAQDFILEKTESTDIDKNTVPYLITKTKVDRRFVSRFRSDNSLEIEFGPGVNSVADTAIVPNPNDVSVGLSGGGLSTMFTAFDPTNFVTTNTYGLAPNNITITFTYLVGGGAKANVLTNDITRVVSFTADAVDDSYENTLTVNNAAPAAGGGDGDTVQDIRLNSLASFTSQYRAVTQEDYLARVKSMPGQFGTVAKAYMTKDDVTFSNYLGNTDINRDPVVVSMYVLGLDSQGSLVQPTDNLMQNIKTYLSNYRMLTDYVKIKPAFVINLGVNFEIVTKPYYNSQDTITRCIQTLKDHFDVSKWEINQPIMLSNIEAKLDSVDGVQTVKKVEIVNLYGEADGYSKYSYDIAAGTFNGVIYPSLDPSIFEVKYPNIDIKGRAVTI